ncbi:MAG TPA: transcription elongation factor GreA [Planctomycetaceae bacterium]|nr:transcription elongation factor GreA [Planctomycetaceae bacterium]HIQ22907.1 transcription elongation factor GreA [Planctomycetota bacterium]
MSDRIPMTRAGYDKRKAELEHLQNVEMPKIEERIGRAREEGDLTENAEYQYAKESQGLLQAKINRLRDELSRAVLIDPSRVAKDEVAFGATVRVRDLDLDEEEEFTLVGAGEEDYAAGKILVTSPLAQGLLGHKVGQRVEIEVPAGTTRFEILEIRYDQL